MSTQQRDGAPPPGGAPSLVGRILAWLRAAVAGSRWAGLLADLAGRIDADGASIPRARPVRLRTVFARFWPYARPHRRLIASALAFSVFRAALAAASIGLFKVLVDRVLVPHDLGAFAWVALGYVAITVLSGAVGFGRRTIGALAGERLVLDLRRAAFDRLQTLSLAFFEQRQLGDVMARMTSDIRAIERLVISGVFRAISYLLRIVFFTAALFWLQWQLALASLVAVPAFGWLARRFSTKLKAVSRERRRRSGALSAVIEESLANIPLVQAYNRQDTETDRLDAQNLARFRARMAGTRLRATFSPLIRLVQLAGTLLVAGLGTYEVSRGALTIGGLLAFAAYLSQLYRPVRRLGSLANTAFTASASAERVLELFDEPPAVADRPGARGLSRVRGQVTFDRVSFGYPGTSTPAVRDISFSAKPGQVVALTGSSGAGKSSLVKLLLRFYDPMHGAVRIDTHDIRDVTMHSLRDNVAVVLQETLVFDATIAENIAYGRPGATDADVRRAARAADLHDFVTELPNGYDTFVGQRGRRLSGGQRQRVAIARAMIRDAPILILDEPTTGLDEETTRRVLEPLRRLKAGRTTIIVSHDPAAVRDADTAVTLDHGRIAEPGKPDRHQAATSSHRRVPTAQAGLSTAGTR